MLEWRFQSSLTLVLVIAFGAGLLLILPGRVRAGLTAANHKLELDRLARKLNRLRTETGEG